ncbi:MAG: DUF3841 domain-containing protein [Clostridia bacterium]|nr:DUF3841 domain-containing protein [Clostridia bacterium]
MLLWTTQPLSLLTDLERDGVYRCAREKSWNLTKQGSLEKPYAWLIAQMRERIGEMPEGVTNPVWAWHTWEYARTCPDPESAAFLKRTEDKVLLTLDIPEERVLLSDFEAWQSVMMGTYVAKGTTKEALEKELEAMDKVEDGKMEDFIRASWENVFLIDPVDRWDMHRGRYVQATFWEVRREDVKETRVLRAAKEI